METIHSCILCEVTLIQNLNWNEDGKNENVDFLCDSCYYHEQYKAEECE
jgi:hypothetical protein